MEDTKHLDPAALRFIRELKGRMKPIRSAIEHEAVTFEEAWANERRQAMHEWWDATADLS